MTDLVERVARALWETAEVGRWEDFIPEARAVIRVVLEEAAKKAINSRFPDDMKCDDDWLAGHWHGRRDAALAIRNLIPKDGE